MVRLVASASSARQDGSYPLIPVGGSLADSQPSGPRRPETAYRQPTGPDVATMSASQQSEQGSVDIRPPKSRPSSRRSIGGAALRVPRPDAPAAAARPTVAVNIPALPDVSGDQAYLGSRPPKPRRTSSLSLPSGRGPSASGARRMHAEPAVERLFSVGGSTHERASPQHRAHRRALRHLLQLLANDPVDAVAGRASSLLSNRVSLDMFPADTGGRAMSLSELIAQAQTAGEPGRPRSCVVCAIAVHLGTVTDGLRHGLPKGSGVCTARQRLGVAGVSIRADS